MREGRERFAIDLKDLCNPYADEHGVATSDDAFRLSVLTPTFNTNPSYLRELFHTLVNQQYGNWEWVLVDDGSLHAPTIATLRELAAADQRVRLILNPRNLGISEATNAALAAATGTHAALVDHDDLLSRDAFLEIYRAWQSDPDTQLYYTDECKLNNDGTLDEFWPKPDWSPAYLENTMCIGHLAVYEMRFIRDLGGFRSEFDGAQDYDLALRASLQNPRVRHLPIFAYIWRVIAGSAALTLDAKHYAIDRQRRAVLDYARRKATEAEVVAGAELGHWRINYPLASPQPLLSYVIPAGGGSRTVRGRPIDLVLNCIRSLEASSFYPNREYIVVHGGNLSTEQMRRLQEFPGVVLVHNPAPAFNFSATLNIGVAHARGEFLCLLNDDVEAITTRGGEELVSYLAINPQVGAIGPLCLLEDGRIQQNGIVLLSAFGPAHAAARRPREFGGHKGILRCRREVFCVGAAIMFIRRSVYDAVGGFSEDLPLNYNDVDFGLKLRKLGYSCVVDPSIEVYHYESTTQGGMTLVEQERLFLKHPTMSDPYFSRWFDPGDASFRLNLRQRHERALNFGSWFDRHLAHRAAVLVPAERVRFCVVVVIKDHPPRVLKDMYRSVVMQTYRNKELVIISEGPPAAEIMDWVDAVRREALTKIVPVDAMEDGAGRTAKLLDSIVGDFIVAVDANDLMSVDALQMLAVAIENNPSKKLFYSDTYKSDMNYDRMSPFFKPDFDPILLTNCGYTNHMLAVDTAFLRAMEPTGSGRPVGYDPDDVIMRAFAQGEEPVHVRELLYASRVRPATTPVAGRFAGDPLRRNIWTRFLEQRGLDHALAIEPNTLSSNASLWRLVARKPLPHVKVVDACEIWGENKAGIPGLVAAASAPGVDWLAVLLSPRDPKALLALSAVGWLDPRVTAVCGVLTDQSGRLVRWSGGVFLPGGRPFDPYADQPFSQGGHNSLLWCQRCIDVPGPVNLLIRARSLKSAASRLPPDSGADALMSMLGLAAHENGDFIAVTPHLRHAHPEASMVVPPVDRQGLLFNNTALAGGSRWYDARLGSDPPYALWDPTRISR
jgi:GT2 family glycosyltransferase